MRIFVAAMAVAALTSACGADRASFRPTTHVTTSGHGGQPAASYDVRVDSGTVAQVNIWSRGAYRADDGRTIVRLMADVLNTGDKPVQLGRDHVRLEAFRRGGQPLGQARLIGASGAGESIPAGEARTVELWFSMRQPIDPDRIGALRLRWGLGYDDGRRYVQFTEFQRVPERTYARATVYYHPVFGFYDPFIYGPPYMYHYRYRAPVRRVIVVPRRPHDADERPAERRADRRR